MKSMAGHPPPLETFISPVLGLPAWNVQQGHGSFLTFEFGEPNLVVYEYESERRGFRRNAYVRGEFHLWIYCCNWRALQDGKQTAFSEDSIEVIRTAAVNFNGQKLISIDVIPENGRSVFHFDLGGKLETWPYGDETTEEQWMIHAPTEAFSFRADGQYSIGSLDDPCNEAFWHPLR